MPLIEQSQQTRLLTSSNFFDEHTYKFHTSTRQKARS